MPTIRQVAQACGVSPMTVSFVLNNRPGEVSAETRDRVLRTVREMGYRPSAVRVRDRRLTNTLGLVSGGPTDSLMQAGYHSKILRGVLVRADTLRQNVTLFTSSLLYVDTHRSIRVYCDGRCDGLLVVSPNRDSKLVTALEERGTPFVLIGSSPESEAVPCCDLDNSKESYRVADYLLKLGHRRIAFCSGPDFVNAVHQRFDGYRRALIDANISVDPSLGTIGIHVESEVYHWIVEILSQPPSRRPTALMAWNDGIAVLAIRAALDLGLRVPEDVSVTGFDDDDTYVSGCPFLTTVRQPYDRIGGGAVEILLAQIKGDETASKRRLEPGEMVIRGSAAPPAR